MGGKAWAIGSKTRWLWFREQDRAPRGGATARRRRCSSPAREQRSSLLTSSSMPPSRPKRIIESEGGICMAVAGDVSRADDVAAIVDACIRSFGRIDVLHNNVGIVEVGGPAEISEESWDRVNDVNLKSMFLTCKHVLPHMERQGKGAIVSIASVSGIRWLGVPYISYAATKAAVIQFTRVIALQYARSAIRANSAPMVHAPGVIAAYGGSAEEPASGSNWCARTPPTRRSISIAATAPSAAAPFRAL